MQSNLLHTIKIKKWSISWPGLNFIKLKYSMTTCRQPGNSYYKTLIKSHPRLIHNKAIKSYYQLTPVSSTLSAWKASLYNKNYTSYSPGTTLWWNQSSALKPTTYPNTLLSSSSLTTITSTLSQSMIPIIINVSNCYKESHTNKSMLTLGLLKWSWLKLNRNQHKVTKNKIICLK